ncbi:Glycosyltransferase-like domain-containing protein 1-like, partial [Pseudolycoriella hygida]
MAKILIIEAFYGGSHKQLLDTILENINSMEYELFTLPAKKWHWRARMSALHFAHTIPTDHHYDVLFSSSVLNLAELLGVRPDLAKCRKIVFFHENQLVYPVREIKDRDCQYGLNQIMTWCQSFVIGYEENLAADVLIFNSNFNRTSFLNNINPFLNIQSDFKLKQICEKIEPKCEVLYFPIKFQQMPKRSKENYNTVLHLIWPHRWEHDKNPQLLTETLLELHKRKIPFRASIIGENFQTVPECFDGIQEKLGEKLINFGYLSRESYIQCLLNGDVVISTAGHEFYGVSMLEATYCGCIPIAPNKLVYPEIYPTENLYNTSNQLIKTLYNWCRNPSLFRKQRDKFLEDFTFERFDATNLIPKFLEKIKIHMLQNMRKCSKTTCHLSNCEASQATYCGCIPIAPNKLVYPEIYPTENLYNTSNQLIKTLYNWCRNPSLFRKQRDKFLEDFTFERFDATNLIPKFLEKIKIQ